ncbi:MFS transporter [Amycolatopsis sp. NPDC057786]|uniref:MFS transporter n=1 Tax=Amycolatopsis sp. NPDC057786 TaxID=3346250 RepID=UPI00366B575D
MAPTLPDPAPHTATVAPDDVPGTRPDPGRRRVLIGSLMIGNFSLFLAYSGLLGILLPNQVASVDPDGKVSSLGMVVSVSAFATLFVQPIVGALSDRTRSRFGRRTPWMMLGALFGAVFLVTLPVAGSVALLAVLWLLVQVSLNIVQGPMTAILADRLPTGQRGTASAFVGVGSMVGATAGVLLAARFATDLGIGYTVFAAVVLVVVLLFVLVNRDTSSAGLPRPAWSWSAFLKGFWVSPRRHPDFAWAFVARMLFVLGYWAVYNFQLYILVDHVGIPLERANAVTGQLALVMLVGTVLSSFVTGPWSDRIGRRKPFVIAASVITAAGLACPLISPTIGGMFAFAAIAGFGFGTYMTLDVALMTQVLPSNDDAAKDLGLLNVATNVPQAVAPSFSAFLITLAGYHILFAVAGLLVLVGAAAFLPIRSVR